MDGYSTPLHGLRQEPGTPTTNFIEPHILGSTQKQRLSSYQHSPLVKRTPQPAFNLRSPQTATPGTEAPRLSFLSESRQTGFDARDKPKIQSATPHGTRKEAANIPATSLYDVALTPSQSTEPTSNVALFGVSQESQAERRGMFGGREPMDIVSDDYAISRLPKSPTQLDPFYSQGDQLQGAQELDERWVTVFGFTPQYASVVLQHFQQFGDIARHVMDRKGGNWMHIQYRTKLQAQKALSKNGKVFDGVVMIGVVPCVELSLMQGETQEAEAPVQQAPRYLVNAYRQTASKYQVEASQSVAAAPQRQNDGILSKTLEFVFGW
eukprot:Colp12_sorted_trinity150504_noHs@2775